MGSDTRPQRPTFRQSLGRYAFFVGLAICLGSADQLWAWVLLPVLLLIPGSVVYRHATLWSKAFEIEFEPIGERKVPEGTQHRIAVLETQGFSGPVMAEFDGRVTVWLSSADEIIGAGFFADDLDSSLSITTRWDEIWLQTSRGDVVSLDPTHYVQRPPDASLSEMIAIHREGVAVLASHFGAPTTPSRTLEGANDFIRRRREAFSVHRYRNSARAFGRWYGGQHRGTVAEQLGLSGGSPWHMWLPLGVGWVTTATLWAWAFQSQVALIYMLATLASSFFLATTVWGVSLIRVRSRFLAASI